MIAPWLGYASAMGALIALVALLLERIVRWRGAPTRWVWLGALLSIVALPVVLNLAMPAPVPVRSMPAAVIPGATAIRRVHYARIDIDRPLLVLWFLASAVIVARIVGSAIALRRRRKSWITAELSGARVMLADELGPAVIGWTKLTTVIPRWALTFDERSRALMLAHEAEHARSGDPYLRSTALVALILMPWNPAIWWAMRRLRLAVEVDCDRRVLRRGVDPKSYASLLLAVGERMSATPFGWATALGGSRTNLERRIVAMTAQVGPRHRRLAIAGVSAAIVAAIAVACASPVPDPLVTAPAKVTATRNPAWSPDTMADFVADSVIYGCTAKTPACFGKGPRTIVTYRPKAPKDTVYVNYQGSIPESISMDFECEIHSDCNGVVGEGRRNDTAFVFRLNNAKLRDITKGGDRELPTVTLDSAKYQYDVEGDRVYRGRGDGQGYFVADSIMLYLGGRGRDTLRLIDISARPSVLIDAAVPKCTAIQLEARRKARAGRERFWPRCIE